MERTKVKIISTTWLKQREQREYNCYNSNLLLNQKVDERAARHSYFTCRGHSYLIGTGAFAAFRWFLVMAVYRQIYSRNRNLNM